MSNPLRWLPLVMNFYTIIWLAIGAYQLWSIDQSADLQAEGMAHHFVWVHSTDRGDGGAYGFRTYIWPSTKNQVISNANAQAARGSPAVV